LRILRQVFEYEAVVRDAVDVHYPCAEMQCSHKISCVSWNAYHKHVLASSDYEGTVSVWDASTGQRTRALQVTGAAGKRGGVWENVESSDNDL
jgi:E3 ubiquitin-protein ligase RFWD2